MKSMMALFPSSLSLLALSSFPSLGLLYRKFRNKMEQARRER
jgi:hypothetical protein